MKTSDCAKWIEENYPDHSETAVAIAVYTVFREAMLQTIAVDHTNIDALLESSALRDTQTQDQIGGLTEAWKEQHEALLNGTHDVGRMMELAIQNSRLGEIRSVQDLAMWRS